MIRLLIKYSDKFQQIIFTSKESVFYKIDLEHRSYSLTI